MQVNKFNSSFVLFCTQALLICKEPGFTLEICIRKRVKPAINNNIIIIINPLQYVLVLEEIGRNTR